VPIPPCRGQSSSERPENIGKKVLADLSVLNQVTIVAVNTQFSIAVHIMAGLAFHPGRKDITSSDLAVSVNTSASFVRRVSAKLSKAGLIETATGKAGACWLAREPREVSLLEIYRAVDAPKAFAIHRYPVEEECPISRGIKETLEKVLTKTQKSMETSLGKITLADLVGDLKKN
jgi:Rrf2 family protein